MPTVLPAPPAGLALVIRAAGDAEVSMGKLSSLIGKEPGLTATLLKLSNSAAYAVGRPVKSVSQATVLLGTRCIRSMAVSHAMKLMVSKVSAGDFDLNQFWEDSLRRATSALLIGRKFGFAEPSEAFTVALLQDLGTLALAVEYPEQSAALQAAMGLPGERRLAEEDRLCDTTHPQFFADNGAEWAIPADFVAVIGGHHGPARLRDATLERLRQVCQVADTVADIGQSKAAHETAQTAREALERLDSSTEVDLEQLVDDINATMEQTARDLEIEIGQQATYQELMEGANMALVDINMSYEELTRALQKALAEKEALLEEKERLTGQLRESNGALQRLAATDTLTGVANRRAFTAALERALGRVEQTQRPLTLLMFDIDHFKKVNDVHGHPAGDDVIKEVCVRAETVLRGGDLVGRLGGEEFGVLLPNCSEEQGYIVAERIRTAIGATSVLTRCGKRITVTVSLGGTSVRQLPAPDADEIYKQSDVALYESKEGGRDRTSWAH